MTEVLLFRLYLLRAIYALIGAGVTGLIPVAPTISRN